MEIPLLRESAPFAARLIAAAEAYREPRYFMHRRVNWSYRYEDSFYDREVAHFLQDPDAYVAGRCVPSPELSDVHAKVLGLRQIGTILMKVLSHWLFNALGRLSDRRVKNAGARIYRKGYVDDVELVFDPNESGVVRAIFPFPISLRRQWRYLRYLCREGYLFKLDGNPYGFADAVRFVARRDVKSLIRLECRAQFRKAKTVLALRMSEVQLSDEFDIGSLDFTRYLARYPVRVINSAHGVGKYFPVHCYGEFHVLTNRQRDYYRAVRECRYVLRQLNNTAVTDIPHGIVGELDTEGQIGLVFLSQRFGGSQELIEEAESNLLEVLRREFAEIPGVQLFYKPHPNRDNVGDVPGFALLSNRNRVNKHARTIYVSFFSTCQIDPSFRGRKFLIRTRHIYPEIAFDDTDKIMSVSELVDLLRGEVKACGGPIACKD